MSGRETPSRGRPASAPSGVEVSRLIVQVARHRDRAAFERLFAHFAPRLKSYFLRLGTPPQQADDLAQDTLLLVWRKADLFDPAKAGAATWVFTLARNLRIDALRRERPALDEPDLAPDNPDPEQAFGAAEAEERVRQALDALPPEQRRAVTLAYFEEKSHSTIEREEQIPLGTVKARLRLAMGRLRTALDPTR